MKTKTLDILYFIHNLLLNMFNNNNNKTHKISKFVLQIYIVKCSPQSYWVHKTGGILGFLGVKTDLFVRLHAVILEDLNGLDI